MTRPLNTDVIGERHAGDGADHAVGPVAPVLGHEQGHAGRQGDAAHLPGDRADQGERRRAPRTTGCAAAAGRRRRRRRTRPWPAAKHSGRQRSWPAPSRRACGGGRRRCRTPGRCAADAMPNAPPITPVATTERVSRYTQNVRANHRNELVTPVTSVLTSSRRNVAMFSEDRGRRLLRGRRDAHRGHAAVDGPRSLTSSVSPRAAGGYCMAMMASALASASASGSTTGRPSTSMSTRCSVPVNAKRPR